MESPSRRRRRKHFVFFLKKGHRSWERGSVKVSSAAEFQAGVVAASSIVEVR
jgi:hypothetical protein